MFLVTSNTASRKRAETVNKREYLCGINEQWHKVKLRKKFLWRVLGREFFNIVLLSAQTSVLYYNFLPLFLCTSCRSSINCLSNCAVSQGCSFIQLFGIAVFREAVSITNHRHKIRIISVCFQWRALEKNNKPIPVKVNRWSECDQNFFGCC